jgi:tRNA uridine 5-carbamoylmethylation protein Kti12
MNKAESLGYDCYMIFVNTSLEVALKRNAERSRSLPDELVKTIWKNCQENMGKFQGIFGNNFVIVDNTEYQPVHRSVQKQVDSFLRKPVQNPIGKKWILGARLLKKHL